MSFILDKLRESGRKRQIELHIREQQNAPLAAGSQPAGKKELDVLISKRHSKISSIFYLVLLVLVINAVVFIWILQPGPSDNKVAQSELISGRQETPAAPVTEKMIAVATNPSLYSATARAEDESAHTLPVKGSPFLRAHSNTEESPNSVADPGDVKIQETYMSANREKVPRRDNRSSGSGNVHSELPPDTDEYREVMYPLKEKKHAGPVDRVADRDEVRLITDLEDLPLSIRETIPSVKISSHLYSPHQTSRLVSINGRIMQEGFTMDNGMYLEEIIQDGVVMRYDGHRFRIKAY